MLFRSVVAAPGLRSKGQNPGIKAGAAAGTGFKQDIRVFFGQTLIDFGATLPALKGSRENLPTILKTGYAPIEQHAQAEAQGSWTDLYALGATFYRCLTGEAIPEATDRILKDSLSAPSKKGAILPSAADRAIVKALAIHSEDRIQTIAEFRDALSRSQ